MVRKRWGEGMRSGGQISPINSKRLSDCRISLFGCPVDNLSMSETVALAGQAMRVRAPVRQVSLNVAKLVNMQSDLVLRRDVETSDIINADGAGILFAARCLGIHLIERVAGIDLFFELLEFCAAEGFRPFFLGATDEVLRDAIAEASLRYPILNIAGAHNGYFTEHDEPALLEKINASCADCLFIGMPTPRKERWLAANRENLCVPYAMGVGGSFDILAGRIKRAPKFFQQAGLEWFYRVLQEPRRMWWRYTKTNFLFFLMLCGGVLRARVRGRAI